MTEPTESCEDFVQREVDTEIRLVNEFLMDIDFHKQNMSHFASGLHVAVKSILAAVDAMKDKRPQDGKQTPPREEEAYTHPCPEVEEEENSAVEEEQMEQTKRENKEAEESDLSSDLRKSLNNSLGGLEKAEEKLTELDCKDHVAVVAGQPSGNSTCYLDFMRKFLANFRQKLLKSCEEFLCMESQELALLQERKALQDLSFQLANSPRRAASPKDDSTASTAKGTTAQRTKEDNAPSDTKTAPLKDISEDSIPSDTAATQEDSTSSATISGDTQKGNTEDIPSMDPSATPQKGYPKNSPPSDQKEGTQQGDDKGASSNTTITPPKDASPASRTEVTPDDQKYPTDQIVLDDDEFDLVSPKGMQRMFGTMSQESKIQFSPASPNCGPEDLCRESKINPEVSPVGGENDS